MNNLSKMASYAEKYDSRFGQIVNGSLFEPKLHRYRTIIRFLMHNMRNPRVKVAYNLMISPLEKLRAGVRIANEYIVGYGMSTEVKDTYSVNKWVDFLDVLAHNSFTGVLPHAEDEIPKEYNFTLVTRTSDGCFSVTEGNRRNCIHYAELDRKGDVKDRLDNLFEGVERVLAEKSYRNIAGWEPNKFNKNGYKKTYFSPLEKALMGIEKFSSEGRPIHDLLVVIDHPSVQTVIEELTESPDSIRGDIKSQIIYRLGELEADLPNLEEIADIVYYIALKTNLLLGGYRVLHNSGLFSFDSDNYNPTETTSLFSSNKEDVLDDKQIGSRMYDLTTPEDESEDFKNKEITDEIKIKAELDRLESQKEELKEMTRTFSDVLVNTCLALNGVVKKLSEFNSKL